MALPKKAPLSARVEARHPPPIQNLTTAKIAVNLLPSTYDLTSKTNVPPRNFHRVDPRRDAAWLGPLSKHHQIETPVYD